MNVRVRINFYNDAGDEGVLRSQMAFPQIPAVGEKVQVRKGGNFYEVISVLYGLTTGQANIDLGEHNLSAATVRGLVAGGWRKSAK